MDIFTFAVTDGTNEVHHRFSVRVNPIDDEIPLVMNNGLRVQEGIRKTVSEFDLKATDKDTKVIIKICSGTLFKRTLVKISK